MRLYYKNVNVKKIVYESLCPFDTFFSVITMTSWNLYESCKQSSQSYQDLIYVNSLQTLLNLSLNTYIASIFKVKPALYCEIPFQEFLWYYITISCTFYNIHCIVLCHATVIIPWICVINITKSTVCLLYIITIRACQLWSRQ